MSLPLQQYHPPLNNGDAFDGTLKDHYQHRRERRRRLRKYMKPLGIKKRFMLPPSFSESYQSVRLIGDLRLPTAMNGNRIFPKDKEVSGFHYYNPRADTVYPFETPVASFMQDDGNIVVLCKIKENDTLLKHIAVPYSLLSPDARSWTTRWLHPEDPPGGGRVYKVTTRAQYWKVQHIMKVRGSKVQVRFLGGCVDTIPIRHLHEDLRPLVQHYAKRYQAGNLNPI